MLKTHQCCQSKVQGSQVAVSHRVQVAHVVHPKLLVPNGKAAFAAHVCAPRAVCRAPSEAVGAIDVSVNDEPHASL